MCRPHSLAFVGAIPVWLVLLAPGCAPTSNLNDTFSTPGADEWGVAVPADAKSTLGDRAASAVNLAFGAPITLHGAFFSTVYLPGPSVDPQTVVDEVFLPRRSVWNRGTVWWLVLGGFVNSQYLTVDLGGEYEIESFVIQTSSDEAYVLSWWDLDAQAWRTAWQVPSGGQFAYGMETRPDPLENTARYVLPTPIVTNQLKLAGAANTGLHYYSVSEIQAWGRAVNSPPSADPGGPYDAAATGWDGAGVLLDGSASSDPDGDALAYSWTVDGEEIAAAAQLMAVFPIGETVVALTVTDPSGASDTQETTVRVTVIEVGVDVRPEDPANTINLRSSGAVPVAFLTDESFDAALIDPATVTFEGYDFSGFVALRGRGERPAASLEDVDGDGDLDLLVHLQTALLPLDGTETACTLGALTMEGLLVRGRTAISIARGR